MIKKASKPPTADEFLLYCPMRAPYSWKVDDQGLVHITVPKFTSKLGKSFCRLLRKENKFRADLDTFGSLVWEQCDGKHTIQQILDSVTNKYPDQKNLDQRLFLFIQQMGVLGYLYY